MRVAPPPADRLQPPLERMSWTRHDTATAVVARGLEELGLGGVRLALAEVVEAPRLALPGLVRLDGGDQPPLRKAGGIVPAALPDLLGQAPGGEVPEGGHQAGHRRQGRQLANPLELARWLHEPEHRRAAQVDQRGHEAIALAVGRDVAA